MIKHIKFQLLDVFTAKAFGGNPLAIFDEANELSSEQMQTIARELNLSESVFLQTSSGEADVKMKIFTPTTELPTAGHPSIGSSFYLLNKKSFRPKNAGSLLLEQNIGTIKVSYEGEASAATNIMMQQPTAAFEQTFKDKKLVAKLLGIKAEDIMEQFPCRVVNCGNPFLIVPIKALATMRLLNLDQEMFRKILEEVYLTGVLAFSTETEDSAHVSHSRMFAPHLGIPEDPATGSAHGPLAAYLHNYNLLDLTKTCTGEQGYEMGRPSQINMRVALQNNQLGNIYIGGKSVPVGHGEIRIP